MRVIGTLALLAVAAFALGAGAGLLWQEPRLVVADLLGDTQDVPWAQPQDPKAWPEGENDGGEETAAAQPAEAEPEVELPSVTAERAEPAEAAPAPAAQLAAAKPAAAVKPTPAVSAAPPHSGVSVQVGAFAERSAADALVKRLKGSGYAAYVVPGSAAPYRVRVGPYGDRGKADAAATKLAKLSLPTWVLEEPGR